MMSPTEITAWLKKQQKSVVLIGLMGAGKTTLGYKLANLLDLPFLDADREIEKAAGCSIADYFAEHGEENFRIGEEKVIARLLSEPPLILATGGGAFITKGVRDIISRQGISVWIKTDLDVLVKRTTPAPGQKDPRPLLANGNRRDILAKLIRKRHPFYGLADITLTSGNAASKTTLKKLQKKLGQYIQHRKKP